jgi:hypothetical protein
MEKWTAIFSLHTSFPSPSRNSEFPPALWYFNLYKGIIFLANLIAVYSHISLFLSPDGFQFFCCDAFFRDCCRE